MQSGGTPALCQWSSCCSWGVQNYLDSSIFHGATLVFHDPRLLSLTLFRHVYAPAYWSFGWGNTGWMEIQLQGLTAPLLPFAVCMLCGSFLESVCVCVCVMSCGLTLSSTRLSQSQVLTRRRDWKSETSLLLIQFILITDYLSLTF